MPAVGVTSLIATGSPASAPRRSPPITAASTARACSFACSAASVTMALSLGFTRAITARCASRTSTGLTARALIMAASSRAVFRVKLSSTIDPSLPRPVDELALDQQKHEIEAVAQGAGREDRRVHVGHGEQLLRLEHALPEAVGRADEHLGHDHDHERQGDAIAQPDEGLR